MKNNIGPRIVLLLDGALFAAFGLLYILIPQQMAAKIGVQLTTPGAIIDVQGLYGGLEFGLGAYLALCSLKSQNHRNGLMVGATLLSGIAIARLIGVLQLGFPDSKVLTLIGMDIFGAILNLFFLRKLITSQQS